MNGSAALILTFLVAIVLVIGGGVVFYMSQLVKSAYDIKVALNAEIEEKLRRIEEDLEKKSRWIKKELVDDVEKMKAAVQYDSARRIEDAMLNLTRQITEIEGLVRSQQAEAAKMTEETRTAILTLDQKLNLVRRDQKSFQDNTAKPAAPSHQTSPVASPDETEVDSAVVRAAAG